MNIGRAISNLGIRVEGIVVLGKDASGRSYYDLIKDRDYETHVVWVDAPTRTNTIILDTGDQTETQLSEQGVAVTLRDLDEVGNSLKAQVSPGDTVILAGSLPADAPIGTFARLTQIAKDAGASVTLMLSGDELAQALEVGPNLVVATQLQMVAYFNYPVRVPQSVLTCAEKLSEKGSCEVLLEMADQRQLVFATPKAAWVVGLPDSNYDAEGTTSGVLEAALAGFVVARMSGKSKKSAIKLAAAAATFSSSQVGNAFGSLKQLKKYSQEVDIAPAEKLIKRSRTPDDRR